jgi:hypothetical protein
MKMRSTTRKSSDPIESQRYHLGPRLPEWQTDSSSDEDNAPPLSITLPAVKSR